MRITRALKSTVHKIKPLPKCDTPQKKLKKKSCTVCNINFRIGRGGYFLLFRGGIAHAVSYYYIRGDLVTVALLEWH